MFVRTPRKSRALATLLGAMFVLLGVTVSHSVDAAEKISMGTLAPKRSPWGKVFNAWAKAVKKKTDGNVEINWYYNGAQGDEGAMVSKMRSGQLDAAAMTSVGLGKINKKFLALQSPGLCSNWACVDRMRDAVIMDLYKETMGLGVTMLGGGDVGLARTFSKGKAIRNPGDLKKMKVYAWQDDPVAPTIASTIGYTPVLKTVPGLLPALQSGQINAATVPALAATQLQWATQFDHVSSNAIAGVIGALVINKKRLDSLPSDSKSVVVNTGEKAGKMLTKRIRKEDAKAYKLVSKRMTVVELTGAEKAAWNKIFKQIRNKLKQGTFPSELVTKLEATAGG